MMRNRVSHAASFSVAVALACLIGSTASASTIITLSDESSDFTDPTKLGATLDFSVSGNTLQLVLTNLTSPSYNILSVYWNASDVVSGLVLTFADHSVAGDVTEDWMPVETGQMADGFGTFDFALIDGVGETNPNIIGSGESITFLMTISGTCADTTSCDMNDFVVANDDGWIGAAKFVNGPGDDSAFGAAIPEPSSALLIGMGLLALARKDKATVLRVGKRRPLFSTTGK